MTRDQIQAAAVIYLSADSLIAIWAMGITQHRHSVQTVREICNFMLLRRNFVRPGAGLCPVRGHSNVHGDRTMGIDEIAPLALEPELDVSPRRTERHNIIAAICTMLDHSAKVFDALGGNFARAPPDSALIAAAVMRLQNDRPYCDQAEPFTSATRASQL